jgi:saccharopine dehydrogenase-like NADP-dependent oxidoreductase
MTNVLILGANGSVARGAIDMFLKETDVQLTLAAMPGLEVRSSLVVSKP